MARLTLWGMQQSYPTLLKGVEVPSGMNRDDFVSLLNMRLGAQFPYIQVPPMLEVLIGTWFRTRQEDFGKMYDAMYAEYNPIENYDRTEERKVGTKHSGTDTDTDKLGTKLTIKNTGTESVQNTGTESTRESGSETATHSGSEGTELDVSAYDAVGYTPREKSLRTPDLTDTRTPDLETIRTPDLSSVRTPDLTTENENSGQDVHTKDYGHQEDVTEDIRAHGNIGVTTNQQMVESEMVLRETWNLYEVIIRMFEREFMCRNY